MIYLINLPAVDDSDLEVRVERGDGGEVVGEAHVLRGGARAARVQEDREAERLELREVPVPARLVERDAVARRVVVRQVEHQHRRLRAAHWRRGGRRRRERRAAAPATARLTDTRTRTHDCCRAGARARDLRRAAALQAELNAHPDADAHWRAPDRGTVRARRLRQLAAREARARGGHGLLASAQQNHALRRRHRARQHAALVETAER